MSDLRGQADSDADAEGSEAPDDAEGSEAPDDAEGSEAPDTHGASDDGHDTTTPGETAESVENEVDPDARPTVLAQELLVACKTGASTRPYERALAALDEDALAPVRNEREGALAFWINCYNAGTQLLLARTPDRYDSRLRGLRFFRTTALTVAGTPLHLDAIEHDVLRRGRSKLAMGYLPSPLISSFALRYRLDDLDPRIHFALNCGAESCPLIRAYGPDEIDDQLDLATRSYLDTTVEYDTDADVATIPRVFRWFRGDFGGGSGVRAFLREHGAIPATAEPKLQYRSWDWTKSVGAFVE